MVDVSGYGLPIKMTAQSLDRLEQALEAFSRSLCLQRQSLAVLELLNDAAYRSSVVSEAIEGGVDRLIVERLLKQGDSNEPGINDGGRDVIVAAASGTCRAKGAWKAGRPRSSGLDRTLTAINSVTLSRAA